MIQCIAEQCLVKSKSGSVNSHQVAFNDKKLCIQFHAGGL